MKTLITITLLLLTLTTYSQQRSRSYWDSEPNLVNPIDNTVYYGDSVTIVDGVIKKYDKNYVPEYKISVNDIIRVPNNKAIAEPYKEISLPKSLTQPQPVIRDHTNDPVEVIRIGTGLSLNGNDTNVPTKDSLSFAVVSTGWSMMELNGHTLVSYESEKGIGTINGLDRYGNIDRRNIKEQTTNLLKQKGIKKIVISLEK